MHSTPAAAAGLVAAPAAVVVLQKFVFDRYPLLKNYHQFTKIFFKLGQLTQDPSMMQHRISSKLYFTCYFHTQILQGPADNLSEMRLCPLQSTLELSKSLHAPGIQQV